MRRHAGRSVRGARAALTNVWPRQPLGTRLPPRAGVCLLSLTATNSADPHPFSQPCSGLQRRGERRQWSPARRWGWGRKTQRARRPAGRQLAKLWLCLQPDAAACISDSAARPVKPVIDVAVTATVPAPHGPMRAPGRALPACACSDDLAEPANHLERRGVRDRPTGRLSVGMGATARTAGCVFGHGMSSETARVDSASIDKPPNTISSSVRAGRVL